MVSSVLDMELDELHQTLLRIRQQYAEDPEYQETRSSFPADWPM
jgi:hypothetical protein